MFSVVAKQCRVKVKAKYIWLISSARGSAAARPPETLKVPVILR